MAILPIKNAIFDPKQKTKEGKGNNPLVGVAFLVSYGDWSEEAASSPSASDGTQRATLACTAEHTTQPMSKVSCFLHSQPWAIQNFLGLCLKFHPRNCKKTVPLHHGLAQVHRTPRTRTTSERKIELGHVGLYRISLVPNSIPTERQTSPDGEIHA